MPTPAPIPRTPSTRIFILTGAGISAQRRAQALECEPNPAHLALARLETALGDRVFLCAQNVDDVHEKAGSARVHHMHGELMKSRCESCFADAVRGPLCARHDPALRLRRARPPSYRLVR